MNEALLPNAPHVIALSKKTRSTAQSLSQVIVAWWSRYRYFLWFPFFGPKRKRIRGFARKKVTVYSSFWKKTLTCQILRGWLSFGEWHDMWGISVPGAQGQFVLDFTPIAPTRFQNMTVYRKCTYLLFLGWWPTSSWPLDNNQKSWNLLEPCNCCPPPSSKSEIISYVRNDLQQTILDRQG